MKYIIICIGLILFGCNQKKNTTSSYYSDSERDTLLTNIITYIYKLPPGASDSTKWNSEFRDFYLKSLPSFYIENYSINKQGWHYYFIIRPVGGSNKRRGVIGKFKLKEKSLMPYEFQETINTPHLEEEIVRERGNFLFEEYLKTDNLDKYLPMKQYIEWPDSSLIYNKKSNHWESTKVYISK